MSEVFFENLLRSRVKRIELRELRSMWLESHPEQLQTHDRDRLLLEALRLGEESGTLRLPALRSFERFGSPPMPIFITLIREVKERQAIDYGQVAWTPELGFWPSLSVTELVTALKINEWIITRRGRFMQVPLRERSLEIFGDEKYLDSRVRNEALFGGRLPLNTIGAKRVEHPLAYRPADAEGKPVLLVENHHTFWSLGEWNETAKRYSAIVYGNGNTICASGEALVEVMRERGASSAEYFGDLDPEGVEIPLQFNQRNHQQLIPCISLYKHLLAVGRRRGGISISADYEARATQWLPSLSEEIVVLWREGFWMPQEGVGLEQLLGFNSESRQG